MPQDLAIDGARVIARGGVRSNVGFGGGGERTVLLISPGVVTGTAPKLGIADSIEVVRLPERDKSLYAWRAWLRLSKERCC